VLLFSLLLLILPLAYVVMAWGMNYVVSLAVCAVMVSVARMSTENVSWASSAMPSVV